jgi:flavin reductase ActVB
VNRTDRRAVADVEPSQVREGFRAAMAQLAGGVVVVSTEDTDGRPYGFTATSFCSVSMDPALVLVCLAETSSSYEAFMDCRGSRSVCWARSSGPSPPVSPPPARTSSAPRTP